MITFAVEVATGAWLALLALTALGTRCWRPAPGPASLALRGEPPAVVSLLAGRLDRDGYPATLLDLAARGWIGLGETEPSRVMCHPPAHPHDQDLADLTGYERSALAHLEFRAAGMGAVPGTALDSGFEAGEDEFRQQFEDEVRADARDRGLTRRRIGRGPLMLLVAAWVPGVTLAVTGLALHHAAVLIFGAVVFYVAALRLAWALYRGTRLSAAGRTALSDWLGFRVALIGGRSGRTAGTALLAAAGDRRIAYAAALGAAPDAVAAFCAGADRDRVWSSFGGSWHRVLVGSPHTRYVPGAPALAGVTVLGVPFAVMTLVVLRGYGLMWAAAFAVFPGCTWWACALWVYGSAARAARRPRLAEFDGQILKLWTEAGEGESATESYCVAIDDGISEQAWALAIGQHAYASSRAGMLVHVRADPRRNQLLAMSPAGAVTDR
jgi:hypothetical protein